MKAITCALLLILWPTGALGNCAPERMVKIVTRNAAPAVAGTFAAKAVTLYRYGASYSRLEKEPDPQLGIHGLIVTNHRDMWTANLAEGTGRHLVDKADDYDFHAPIAPRLDGPLADLEFGCELEYMNSQGIEPRTVRVTDKDFLEYEISAGDDTVRLLVDPATGNPWTVELKQDGKTQTLLRYVEYETDLEPDLSLFEKPPRIDFVEEKPFPEYYPDSLAGLDDLDDEVLGYAQPTDAATGVADCVSGPHAGPSCPQPVADETDWHLDPPEGAAFWAGQCGTSTEGLAGFFEEIAKSSKAFDECASIGCSALASDKDGSDIRSQALRELLALWLNTVSGRLADAATAQESIARLESTLCDPASTSEDIRKAKALAEAINTGSQTP